jgi:F-type H+-transporting ATPase subunit gamma
MANLKDIRTRIDSTKNTQQITRAMKLVSTAKLRKAQNQIVNMRPYAQTLLRVIGNIVKSQQVQHPLITPHAEVKRVLLLIISSDRGLAGGFNSNISKFAEAYVREHKGQFETLDLMFIGKKSAEYFLRRGMKSVETILRLDKDIAYTLAAKIAEKAMKQYLAGEYDEVRLVYNEFKSAISQEVVSETLLPVDLERSGVLSETSAFSPDMIFEPTPGKMVEQLLLKHFSVQVFRAMAESVAAEHGARMTAMENATNNAKEVLNRLTLQYNKARQEKITTELIEIVSGAEALK